MTDSSDTSSEAERRRLIRAEWRAAIDPFDRQALEANSNALALGVTGLRALFVLNGGALVVLPVYLSLLGTDLDAAFLATAMAAASFLAGLVLAGLATLFAYFTETQKGRLAFHGRQARANALSDPAESDAADSGAEKFKAGAARGATVMKRLRLCAIGFAIFSLACFAGGAYFAAIAVMTGPGQDDETSVSKIDVNL
ncbi:MAG TPA: hypothetical protein VI732_03675 [Alphaproteobacteria bacterium]|nr:hypothetical protein [Alphaproteobacteria bacterium]